jgi:hypothetical protein
MLDLHDNYVELGNIILEINRLLPQLGDFIGQFNKVVIEAGINVISDAHGNLSIDVPSAMSDSIANKVTTRLGIIDRLITEQGTTINSLFQKGLGIETGIKKIDTNYTSQLTEQIAKFKELNSSYKH